MSSTRTSVRRSVVRYHRRRSCRVGAAPRGGAARVLGLTGPSGRREVPVRGDPRVGRRLTARRSPAWAKAAVLPHPGLASVQGDYDAMRTLHHAALDVYRELGDHKGIITELTGIGFAERGRGDTAAARYGSSSRSRRAGRLATSGGLLQRRAISRTRSLRWAITHRPARWRNTLPESFVTLATGVALRGRSTLSATSPGSKRTWARPGGGTRKAWQFSDGMRTNGARPDRAPAWAISPVSSTNMLPPTAGSPKRSETARRSNTATA